MNFFDDFWRLYASALRRIREAEAYTFLKVATVLNRFRQPTCVGGAFFFPDAADDILDEALQAAGWHVSLQADCLWTAAHPETRAHIWFVEGDLYDETPSEGGKR